MLQELLELAEQLAGPDGYNSVIDNDPLSDPLAGFLGDDEAAAGFSGFVEPYVEDAQGPAAALIRGTNADGFDVSDFDDAEAEELFAAVAEMQQRSRAAAQSLAAHDAAAVGPAAAAGAGSSGEAGSSRPGSLAAELLSWEAAELAKQPHIDIEAAAAAMQRGEVLGGDLEDEYEEGDEDEYELDREDEDWLGRDPQLKQMMQADGAAFARMLAEVNGEDEEPGSGGGGSKGTSASAAARRGVGREKEEQQESWAGLKVEDWLEAAGSTAADREGVSRADEEPLSGEAGLSDLLSQIDADPSLDGEAKRQAKMSIQGVFNDPQQQQAAAAGESVQKEAAPRTGWVSGIWCAASSSSSSSSKVQALLLMMMQRKRCQRCCQSQSDQQKWIRRGCQLWSLGIAGTQLGYCKF
ncbi:hypothetical protein COO60DRAFT_25460 [Scenedesmus sp. NREL 46B-D3]|nr:hypothetical protein COO60DRAFT_25460 [Scenedesmus sp. NREL 46B-D3]